MDRRDKPLRTILSGRPHGANVAISQPHRTIAAATRRSAIQAQHEAENIRPGTDERQRQAAVEEWYRQLLKEAVPALIAKWEPILGVKVKRVFVQRMKTRWGSCNARAGTIRLNTDLAKKPPECLEYLVVHELVHLLEPTHNARFVAAMDKLMPQWRQYRLQLNQLPVRHEQWQY